MFKFNKEFIFMDPLLKPIEFWPYSSYVTDRVITMEYLSDDSIIDKFQRELVKLFLADGFDCVRQDNKTVFGLQEEDKGRKFYIGFKDGNFHIGTSFRTDHWHLNRKQKKEVSPLIV